MYLIKHLVCLYCDAKNPSRCTDRDKIKEIDRFQARNLEEAKEAVFSILARYGGADRLLPKILSNHNGLMWIECDRPFASSEKEGTTDMKCLAFEIEYRESSNSLSDSPETLRDFAICLGPDFSL